MPLTFAKQHLESEHAIDGSVNPLVDKPIGNPGAKVLADLPQRLLSPLRGWHVRSRLLNRPAKNWLLGSEDSL